MQGFNFQGGGIYKEQYVLRGKIIKGISKKRKFVVYMTTSYQLRDLRCVK
jgi:hypothetical protein